jgi:hypothetical protein
MLMQSLPYCRVPRPSRTPALCSQVGGTSRLDDVSGLRDYSSCEPLAPKALGPNHVPCNHSIKGVSVVRVPILLPWQQSWPHAHSLSLLHGCMPHLTVKLRSPFASDADCACLACSACMLHMGDWEPYAICELVCTHLVDFTGFRCQDRVQMHCC